MACLDHQSFFVCFFGHYSIVAVSVDLYLFDFYIQLLHNETLKKMKDELKKDLLAEINPESNN